VIAALLFSILLSGGSALAYAPEVLLRKIAVPTPELSAPGSRQYLNPLSKVRAGWERPDLEKKENEFSLSLSPKSIREAVAYKRLATALRQDIDVSQKLLRSTSLQTAYTALISAALAKEQQSAVAELRDLQGKSQKLNAIAARRDRADAKNVLKASGDLQKSMEEVIELESQLAGIRKYLAGHGLQLEELETGDLIGPEEIEAAINALPVNKVALTSKKIITELEVTKQETNHSLAERSKLLDEVKLAMEQAPKKEKVYKLEVSFNLPFLAAQDLSDFQDRLKAAEAEAKGQQLIFEESLRSAGLAEVLKRKISLYRAMGEGPKWESSALLRQDPALALDLRRTSVALRLTRANLLAEIRNLYVSLLLETEALAGSPGVNHLSRSKRKI
jgi:hypothetical protein